VKPGLIVQASAVVTCLFVMAFALGSGSASCTPAQSAAIKTFESEFLANYQAGLDAVESAFDAIDPPLATIAGLVDVVIVDTITLLEDAGVFGDAGVSAAETIRAEAQAKITPAAEAMAVKLRLRH
jgi:hypothetical protein